MAPSRKLMTIDDLMSPGLALARRDQRERVIEGVALSASKGLIKLAESYAMDGEVPNPVALTGRWSDALESSITGTGMAPDVAAEAFSLLLSDPMPFEVYDTSMAVITDARAQNLGLEALRENVREAMSLDSQSASLTAAMKFNGMKWISRIKRTARTVSTGLDGWVTQNGIWLFGVEHKRWVTRRDEHVRHTHHEADGQTVRSSDPFFVGGVPMMYPANRSGPAEEVFNCRCVMVGVLKP